VTTRGLHGSMPALVTPLTAERTVDEEDLERLVRRAVADGATGVLVAGTTGEGAVLEPAAREQLVRRARATLDAATTAEPNGWLLAGASGPSVAAVEADVGRLAAAGADAVLVLAPSTYPLTADELAAFHLDVADRADIDTVVYHIPQLTGSSLTPDTLARVADHDRIIGVKDSSTEAERRAAFVAATDDTVGFAVMTGHASTLLEALRAGAAGSITAIANVRQRGVVALHDAVGEGDDAAARREQDRLSATSAAFGDLGPSLPAVLKAALQLEGVVKERWCAPPLGSVPPDRLDRVRTASLR
jgi:4-hydroxy-tetrahydrodipicolinate synthase